MMLTVHKEDPNRVKELERRRHEPHTYGDAPINDGKVLNLSSGDAKAIAEEAKAVIAKAELDKKKLKEARNVFVKARELSGQAQSNLKNAKDNGVTGKEFKALGQAVVDTAATFENAEQVLNDLIDG